MHDKVVVSPTALRPTGRFHGCTGLGRGTSEALFSVKTIYECLLSHHTFGHIWPNDCFQTIHSNIAWDINVVYREILNYITQGSQVGIVVALLCHSNQWCMPHLAGCSALFIPLVLLKSNKITCLILPLISCCLFPSWTHSLWVVFKVSEQILEDISTVRNGQIFLQTKWTANCLIRVSLFDPGLLLLICQCSIFAN